MFRIGFWRRDDYDYEHEHEHGREKEKVETPGKKEINMDEQDGQDYIEKDHVYPVYPCLELAFGAGTITITSTGTGAGAGAERPGKKEINMDEQDGRD